jgi:hypothetical protein
MSLAIETNPRLEDLSRRGLISGRSASGGRAGLYLTVTTFTPATAALPLT